MVEALRVMIAATILGMTWPVWVPSCAAARAAAPFSAASLFPFVLSWDDATPGVTDLSGWLPKPAGKSGTIHAGDDGHLYAGNERIRFFGVDLAFSANFPRPEDAGKIAARLAKFGINIVRFHIMDMKRFPDGLLARNVSHTRDFDPEALARLDYFIAQLKRNGIYTYLCLLNYRPFNAADGLPKEIELLGAPYQERHVAGFYDARLLELQKEYARKLLTHRNPQTGMTYSEDPTVAFVEINNENGLIHAWLDEKVDRLPGVLQAELKRQWNEWLRKRYGTTARLRQAWGAQAQPLGEEMLANADFSRGLEGWVLERHDGAEAAVALSEDVPETMRRARSACVTVTAGERTSEVQRDWLRFLWETEDRYWQAMNAYLKKEVKVKALVIGTIVGCSTPNLMARLDCVDAHAYWQHPVFPGRPWDPENWVVHNRTMVNDPGGVLPDLALRRVWGKPFSVTEYGHCAPNTFVSEGHLLRAAYSALQDWDYISASRYSHQADWDLRRIRNFFDIDQHPAKMVTLIPAAAMFLRGDVKPAQVLVAATLDRERELEVLRHSSPWELAHAGHVGVSRETTLVHRTAIVVEGQTVPAGTLRPEQVRIAGDKFVSDTGELVWDLTRKQRGVVTLNAVRSKAVIGYGAGQRFNLGDVIIEPGPTLQDGWSAITLTVLKGDSITPPSQSLITATGYVENTKMGWKNLEKSSVGADWGEAPSLVEGIPARITFPFTAHRAEAWALDERGQRKAQLSVEADTNGNAVVAIGPQYRTLWYEVSAKQAGTRSVLTH